ncbi:hypothetical protein BDW42DRAFT_89773 [Aspergillus taichungensis]|uniref:Uncharacterized protein n=1 Tax=Aspergillus taichungensis TaxID=482145 RepID=A0A2J5HWH3_9EURO|nr:hypothetical protein BDW42DRAFT_89773 [Aspergillus taichungensis]
MAFVPQFWWTLARTVHGAARPLIWFDGRGGFSEAYCLSSPMTMEERREKDALLTLSIKRALLLTPQPFLIVGALCTPFSGSGGVSGGLLGRVDLSKYPATRPGLDALAPPAMRIAGILSSWPPIHSSRIGPKRGDETGPATHYSPYC